MLENHNGHEIFSKPVINRLIDNAYVDAIREHGLKPFEKTNVTIMERKAGEPLCFTIKIIIKPDAQEENVMSVPHTEQIKHADIHTKQNISSKLGGLFFILIPLVYFIYRYRLC
ncbi:hypothetical protein FACS1894184_05930 [Clostridia bacterium]|nr:hypothetical protein FACS1894184_05930 [Clostridia bacterium]